MNEICEWKCDQRINELYPENLQPIIDLKPILDRLLSANVSEAEAKALLYPIEEELKRRTCGLVWKRGGATIDLLNSIGNRLPIFTSCPEMTIKADKGPDHVLIEGENLLTLLAMQYTHVGKDRHGLIDVIYIDPPYNTKSTTMAYNDRFETSEWLSMMDARLRLARNLLAKKGVIFVSIDDRHQAELKLLMNDIFGSDNFVAQVISISNSRKNNSNLISTSHDYLLCYAKNKRELKNESWKVEKSNIEEFIKEANRLLASGLSFDDIHKELNRLVKYPKFHDFKSYTFADERGVFETRLPCIKEGNKDTEIIHPITGRPCKKPTNGWRFSDRKIRELLDQGMFQFGKDETKVPRVKRYLDKFMKQVPNSVACFDAQDITEWLHKQHIDFDYPKPVTLLKHILSIFPNNIKVLDFFAGSGTTLHAVLELNAEDGGNRQCILCTNNELGKKAKDKAKKAGIDLNSANAAKFGVCQAVTWPRIKAIITGDTPSGAKVNTVYPDNSVFTYRINEKLTDLIADAQTEQRRNDLMTVHAVSYIALKEGLYRPEAHEDWHLLWKDDAGVIVITDPDMEYDRMINNSWSDIVGKKVKKVYCPVGQEQEIDSIVYTPYPKGILDILRSARI